MGQIGEGEFRNTMKTFPRDLLRRFVSSSSFAHKFQRQSEEDGEELELSLGLSMNGHFGVDPQAKLSRSSSIPDFLNLNAAKGGDNEDGCSSLPLVRACSMPTETEEEWRKRKELQTLRRMEAKRKRSEKQRNLKVFRDRSCRGINGEENGEVDKRQRTVNGTCQTGVVSQGPLGSQGSGSSEMSESETQQFQGSNKCSLAGSPPSAHSTLENERKPVILGGGGGIAAEAPEKSNGRSSSVNQGPKPDAGNNGVKQAVRNILEDMPCVSTTGDGPDGRRIEGFLYRYKKGEEVRIVCVCHGSFLSPAEFVKHAGGSDVAHPLKHIVVNPSAFL